LIPKAAAAAAAIWVPFSIGERSTNGNFIQRFENIATRRSNFRLYRLGDKSAKFLGRAVASGAAHENNASGGIDVAAYFGDVVLGGDDLGSRLQGGPRCVGTDAKAVRARA
jgi:hypothetical protein